MHEKTAGSFPVSSLLFSILFVMVIILIGALTFVPTIIFGPGVEQTFFLKRIFFQ
jgi:K+-transporting ATPase A subunit